MPRNKRSIEIPVSAEPETMQKPIVMPDLFYGGVEDEWEDWLNNFKACAKINGWNDESKCMFLGVRMKGVAQKVYFELDEDQRNNWPELVAILGSRFRNSKQEDLCKSQFLVRKRGTSESLLDFGNAIRRLSRKAYPTMDPSVRDELARDQFLRGMNHSKLSMDLRKQLPKTLDDTIRIAVEWETIEQDVSSDSIQTVAREATCCSHPATANAISSDQTSREMLAMMKELTLLLKENRETSGHAAPRRVFSDRGRGRGSRRENNNECWHCGQVGHKSRECRRKECWNCGQVGHLQADCRNNRGHQEN